MRLARQKRNVENCHCMPDTTAKILLFQLLTQTIFPNELLPSHLFIPSPVRPLLHEHSNEPNVFVHEAFV